MYLVTSVCGYNGEFVYVPGLVVQAWTYAYLSGVGADFELPQLAEAVPEGVVHHGVHPAVGVGGRDLEKKNKCY